MWRRFVDLWPTPAALAEAGTQELLAAWAGLGYNRRALALREAARAIVADHRGRVPAIGGGLGRAAGIGPYTARAVAAAGFGVPVAPLDVNVRRVVSRVLGVAASSPGLQAAADDLVSRSEPGRWFDAVMDLASGTCYASSASLRRVSARARSARHVARSSSRSSASPTPCRSRRPLAGSVVGSSRPRPRLRPMALAATARRASVSTIATRSARPRAVSSAKDSSNSATTPSACATEPARYRRGRRTLAPVSRDADPARGRRERVRRPTRRLRFAGDARSHLVPCRPTPPRRCPQTIPPSSRWTCAGLRQHWAARAALPAISAETMTGADRRAQSLGVPGGRLMEHAGTAVAAAVKALATDLGRWGTGPDRHPVRPGQQRRRRLRRGPPSGARRCLGRGRGGRRGQPTDRPGRGEELGPRRARRGHRQGPGVRSPGTSRCSASASTRPRSSSTRCSGPASAARCASPSAKPSRSSVGRARPASPSSRSTRPTAVDLSSGEPSDPAVVADLTVTFHRPKTGLLTRRGARYAGKVLVAPIGIPAEADRG